MSEILAPAGSPESVYAAVRSGADAVYLAGEAFNARRGAQNFTHQQLQEAVAYCHAHGVKVHYALNILVKDSEMAALETELERILSLGADALILQDLGVAAIVKKMCPTMPLHASTQLSAHTLAAVKELEQRGFSRVVLSREMSLEEMRRIRENCKAELEVFVHGALCMCVSGQCLMSAFFGARSGNRGLCAQPCRLPFRAPGGTGYDLSLKDNSLLEYLPQLAALGIDSFKIEGRMKRPEYVAASVSACKAALEGSFSPAQKEDLKRIFSRQGFTDGYLTGARGKEMFGARTKEDVTAADNKLLKTYAALYAKETPRLFCRMDCRIQKGDYPVLTMTAGGKTVTVTGEHKPEAALHRALTKEELTERLSKLGGTGFAAESVQVTVDEGLMLSAGDINALRRSAVTALTAALSAPAIPQTARFPQKPPKRVPAGSARYLRFSSVAQTEGLPLSFDKIILPIEEAEEAVARFGTQQLILEAPRVFFGLEERLIDLLEKAKACGVQEIAAGNIAAFRLAKERGFRVLAGLGMNIFNSYACDAVGADEILLSPEMSAAQIAALHSPQPFGCVVYGHFPLMITRNCPLQNGRSCAACDKKGFITDRKGEQFPVRCRFGASEIFNPHALYFADRLSELASDFTLLYFTVETPTEIAHILNICNHHAKPDFPFTRGLYAKGVL